MDFSHFFKLSAQNCSLMSYESTEMVALNHLSKRTRILELNSVNTVCGKAPIQWTWMPKAVLNLTSAHNCQFFRLVYIEPYKVLKYLVVSPRPPSILHFLKWNDNFFCMKKPKKTLIFQTFASPVAWRSFVETEDKYICILDFLK
jgi:hypothetical protein